MFWNVLTHGRQVHGSAGAAQREHGGPAPVQHDCEADGAEEAEEDEVGAAPMNVFGPGETRLSFVCFVVGEARAGARGVNAVEEARLLPVFCNLEFVFRVAIPVALVEGPRELLHFAAGDAEGVHVARFVGLVLSHA